MNRTSTAPKSAPRVKVAAPAAQPSPLEAQAVRGRNDLHTLAQAVAIWETPGCDPLAIAREALDNIAADLIALEIAMDCSDGAINLDIARRVLAGIQGRAEASARLVERIDEERRWQS